VPLCLKADRRCEVSPKSCSRTQASQNPRSQNCGGFCRPVSSAFDRDIRPPRNSRENLPRICTCRAAPERSEIATKALSQIFFSSAVLLVRSGPRFPLTSGKGRARLFRTPLSGGRRDDDQLGRGGDQCAVKEKTGRARRHWLFFFNHLRAEMAATIVQLG